MILSAASGVRQGISGVAATCLQKPTGEATSPLATRIRSDQEAVQSASGALFTRRPRTTTLSAMRKELRAHRRVIRTRHDIEYMSPIEYTPPPSRKDAVLTTYYFYLDAQKT